MAEKKQNESTLFLLTYFGEGPFTLAKVSIQSLHLCSFLNATSKHVQNAMWDLSICSVFKSEKVSKTSSKSVKPSKSFPSSTQAIQFITCF